MWGRKALKNNCQSRKTCDAVYMTPQERSTRHSRRLPVSLGGRLAAMTLNVSRSGFRIEMPQVFLPGSQVHGYVMDGVEEIPFRGEVAWAQPGNPQRSLLSVMGIRFASISERLSRLLPET